MLAAAVVMAAGAMQTAPAQAAGTAPWCAVLDYGRGSAYWDCQYASIEACRPNVIAGNRGFCNPNPAWQAAADMPKRQRHRAKRY
jgi:hypothetical protein